MFDRYTEQARRAVFFALQEAADEGSPNITTSHFLVGMIHVNAALAERVLGSPDAVAQMLTQLCLPPDLRQPSPTHIDRPLSPELKYVMAIALREAQRRRDREIDTTHLLLALLLHEKSHAARILAAYGVTAESIFPQ